MWPTFNNLSIATLSKSSCITCRKQHKKCDKVMPTCGLCTKRNRKCTYDDQQASMPMNSITEEASSELQKIIPCHIGKDALSLLTHMLKFNMPVLSTEQIIKAAKIVEKDKDNNRDDLHDCIANPEDVALVYCIYAIWTKYWGTKDQSIRHFNKARKLIGPSLDSVFDSYVTAACCCFLGVYCAVDYDLLRAKFYYNATKLFVDSQLSVGNRDPKLNFIEHEFRTLNAMITNSFDLHFILKQYVERKCSLDAMGAQGGNSFQLTHQEIQDIHTDLRNGSNDCYPLNPSRIHWFSENLYDATNKSLYRSNTISLVVHGAYLQYYTQVQDWVQARREADTIVEIIVTNKVLFKTVGAILGAAVSFHLQEFNKNLDDRNALLQVLKKDYDAVKLVWSSSILWTARLNDLKNILESVIWDYTNQQNILSNQNSSGSESSNESFNDFINNSFSIIGEEDLFDPGMTEKEFEDFFLSITRE
ncbi:hypothetical protein AKO1_008251 [Acrasis kona]|uniref:Zn(2)-C6 fungal-type domain-containing protein n=1 Tax=Acrasis kona TaxID=1008807 RepID=A0AAW2YMW8_9EUKA